MRAFHYYCARSWRVFSSRKFERTVLIIAYDVIIPERFVGRARKLLQSCEKPETSKIDENRTKPVLNANDLRGTKSPSGA